MIKNKKISQIKTVTNKHALTSSPWLKIKSNINQKKTLAGKPSLRENLKTLGFSSLKLGEVYTFKVTALGPNNIGIDEFSYGHSIFLPNTKIGDVVKAKVVKIYNKKYKFAIAQVIKKIQTNGVNLENGLTHKVGEILDVTISKVGPNGTGIVELDNNYFLIVPKATLGQTLKVQITRLKAKYAFAKNLNTKQIKENSKAYTGKIVGKSGDSTELYNTEELQASLQKRILNLSSNEQTLGQSQSSINTLALSLRHNVKITETTHNVLQLPLPLKIKLSSGGAYFVLKVQDLIVFVKPSLGAKPGNIVKIKLIKVSNSKKKSKFAIGKIIAVNPMESSKKRSLVRGTVRQMLQSGMHFGEKAVKCHARMKKYIWVTKKGQNKNKPLVKKGRHLMNLLKTRRCLKKTLLQLSKYALKGRPFLFVGTKKSAASLIARASLFSKTSFFVNTRWLGGLLTNWKSILKSISKIRPILKQKQKLIKKILEKRKNIKSRLLQKARIFRKKSKLLIQKGRAIISLLKNEQNKTLFKKRSSLLNIKREQVLQKAAILLEKRKNLLEKRNEVLKQSLLLKQKGIFVEKKYKALLNQYTANQQKLREFTTLLIISKQIAKIQQENTKNTQIKLGTVSLNTLLKLNKGILPDPPKEILKKIVLLLNPTGTTKTQTKNSESGQSEKVLILSKLLSQFGNYSPILRTTIQFHLEKNKQLEQKFTALKQTLNLIKTKINYYTSLKNEFTSELNKIKKTLVAERQIARLLKRKMRVIIAQKRLIKFLPKLRYLPTPQIKITETVKFLMKNIVDPKLKYPIELIYDEKVKNQSKKIAAARKKKWQRLEKYFGGIAKMTQMNKNQISKMIAIVIGQQEEINAVRECEKFGIKMIHVVDTNCNPSLANHFVPANDDSINSIRYLLTGFLKHIRLAQKLRLRVKKLRKKQLIKQLTPKAL